MPREPQAGQAVTADWGRELVRAARRARVVAGEGIRVTEGPDGVIVSAAPRRAARARAAARGHPRPFDISVADGVVTLSRAYWQVGGELRGTGAALSIGVPGGQGHASHRLYVLVPASPGPGPVLSYTPDTMGGLMFPVALYVLGNDGAVQVDLRGSQVVMYR